MPKREEHRHTYVVETETGHVGFVSTTVIRTRAGMHELVDRLSSGLVAKEAELRDPLESRDRPLTLFREYATKTGGQSSRVPLNFQVAPILEPYHVAGGFRAADLLSPALCVLGLALLYFAIVGIRVSFDG
jgi:hypothetical protein